MEEDLKLLIKKRGAVKGRITLFRKYLAEIEDKVSNLGENELLDETLLIELETRCNKIEEIFGEFEGYQTEIELNCNEEDFELRLSERDAFENDYFKAVSRAKKILKSRKDGDNKSDISSVSEAPSNMNSGASSNVNNAVRNVVTENLSNSVKLPLINIPTFDGSYNKWLEFKDTFESLIHKNQGISEVQKFHYLRAQLLGSAKQVIESIEFSAVNYNIAWESLCKRFNNKRILIQNHISGIFEVSPLRHESSEGLRNLCDTVSKHLRALENLGRPVQSWDDLIIHHLASKLDRISLKEWESLKVKNETPLLSDFKEFIKGRADLLETLEHSRSPKVEKDHISGNWRKPKEQKAFLSVGKKCPVCKDLHELVNCKEFLNFPVPIRVSIVKRNRLCMCCFSSNHFSMKCTAPKCAKCSMDHHTLLHYSRASLEGSSAQVNKGQEVVVSTTSGGTEQTSITMSTSSGKNCGYRGQQVLLSTAVVKVKDVYGELHECRALLDSGSMSNFLTEKMYNRLGLQGKPVDVSVVGISQSACNVKKRCEVEFLSSLGNFKASISCLIIPSISEELPLYEVNLKALNIPGNIQLANPGFHIPEEIDMLIGAGFFWKLVRDGQISLGNGMPCLQNTCLGWIISGEFQNNISGGKNSKTICNFAMDLDEQNQLQKFWQWEEPGLTKNENLSSEEVMCENLFVSTTSRGEDGRFVVTIPLKDSVDKLGDSKQMALQRLFSLERRFQKSESLRKQYGEYMAEYERVGHMTKTSDFQEDEVSFFLPHHGVIKEDSSTTKLRVVYDGSAQSSSGVSINDLQYVGPKIQDNLLSILLRFRQNKVAFCADIAKMYRQIWLMDDLISGSSSLEEAIEVCKETSSILISAGFELRKFCSNNKVFLSQMGPDNPDIEGHNVVLDLGEGGKTKTLGLFWNCSLDVFTYKIGSSLNNDVISKRKILSDIAQIFDPLGLLSASIIIPKIILQKLWLLKLSWDDEIPIELRNDWLRFKSEMLEFNSLLIPRFVSCENPKRMELHGFSDASQNAFGACVYIRTVDSLGCLQVKLLCAKSRVAPIKALTIPKLELSAALLLSKLVQEVLESKVLHFDEMILWCDSTVVLSWIRSPANQFNQFVSNRVAQIQTLVDCDKWRYVKSEDNPADLVSRGVFPSKLKNNKMWFNGPDWLGQLEYFVKDVEIVSLDKLPETRKKIKAHVCVENIPFELLNKISDFDKFKRIFAWCKRFVDNCRSNKLGKLRRFGELSVDELRNSERELVKIAQSESFSKELAVLKKGQFIKKGKLSGLNAFLDKDGILRVGGRLRLSGFEYDKKFPALLSSKHILSRLIVRHEHKILLHAGPQMVLSSIRERYWPIGGRNLVKKIIYECVVCARVKPLSLGIQMGNLPKSRLTIQPPFNITGVDFAGPFNLKIAQGRGNRLYKGYICLFVCFTTRAIHLEVVTSLSTEAFIATLRRFVSRRGKPSEIHSDNGKNFLGASSKLKEFGHFLEDYQSKLEGLVKDEGIKWHFIPAYSPHFGGLWEAGVKTVKYHLKRVVGNHNVSYEDFTTILCQIEAIVNSRPLTPMSSDPRDLDVITPAHFLIGRRLTSVPDKNLLSVSENRLARFERLQQMQQSFWSRWCKEYVAELQNRVKWKHSKDKLKEGDLVLIKEDNIPPLDWRMGRVLRLYPGVDGTSRVAILKTLRGEVTRSFSKLCPLPIEADIK
ncbi:uncharacterized protein LOC126736152 [Anthonomus grandis grandis]|uniref:uncharacterized protein LOC126736152 n=1 Tax=Anthonomus grandis grandis TaxID=2921223 RepID=UPI0021663102|nr:uncharacterized protein LOC126736152 [Anthonomus grandis grandis]